MDTNRDERGAVIDVEAYLREVVRTPERLRELLLAFRDVHDPARRGTRTQPSQVWFRSVSPVAADLHHDMGRDAYPFYYFWSGDVHNALRSIAADLFITGSIPSYTPGT